MFISCRVGILAVLRWVYSCVRVGIVAMLRWVYSCVMVGLLTVLGWVNYLFNSINKYRLCPIIPYFGIIFSINI